MKKLIVLFFVFPILCFAKPKLFIGIVVDQMRYDYLHKYEAKFSDGGFKKLMKNGFSFHNLNYNYVPTYTGPGHCSIFTGTSPSVHGIVGNNWFDVSKGEGIYCVDDESVMPLGENVKKNKMSPKNQLANTIGDELKLFTSGKGKVFAVSMKDRASILPAGRAANGAYWFDTETGQFITSSYYMQNLQKWVIDFNAKKLPQSYLEKGWNTFFPLDQYTESGPDKTDFESPFEGESEPVFPHNLKDSKEKELFRKTPFANTLTLDFAKQIIENENLGKDNFQDFLSVSFSSPDYVGHKFGISSVELEDIYIRLDRDIELFINYLDKQIGKDSYTLFLTADHGAAYGINNDLALKIPADALNEEGLKESLNNEIEKNFSIKPILAITNQHIYLDDSKLKTNKLEIESFIEKTLYKMEMVKKVYFKNAILKGGISDEESMLIINGFYPKRCGDIVFSTNSNIVESGKKGTSHGTSYSYDRRVPLLFYGHGVKKGESYQPHNITDIAPTTSQLMLIPFPGATTGRILSELFEK